MSRVCGKLYCPNACRHWKWLALAILVCSTSLLHASPRDDGEFMLDTSLTYMPNPSGNEDGLASSGSEYLVAWTDTRNAGHIYATRVSLDGTVLDTAGIHVCLDNAGQDDPAASFNGENYVVVWSDRRQGIYGARITPSGVLLDSDGFAIYSRNWVTVPSLCFDGTNFLLTWLEGSRRGGFGLKAMRMSRDCSPLDTGIITVGRCADSDRPSLAYTQGNFICSWIMYDTLTDQRSLWSNRITNQGVLLDTTSIVIDTNAGAFSASADLTRYMITWTSSEGLMASRMSYLGVVIDHFLVANYVDNHVRRVGLCFDGRHYLALWTLGFGREAGLYDARIDTNGAVMDPNGVMLEPDAISLVPTLVAAGPNGFLGIWGESGLQAVRISPDARRADSSLINLQFCADIQSNPEMAYGDGVFLAVWDDSHGSDHDIWAARVTTGGEVLDPGGIPVCSMPGDQVSPDVAYDGANFLVVWSGTVDDSSWVFGVRVSPGGALLDSCPLTLMRGSDPAVAFGSSRYLVMSAGGSPRGNFVSQAGVTPDDTGFVIPISGSVTTIYNPAIAFGGSSFFAVWGRRRWQPYPSGYWNSAQGTVIDTLGNVRTPVLQLCGEVGYLFNVEVRTAIASNGSGYLAAWDCVGGFYQAITRNGYYGSDAHALSQAASPCVARAGADYILCWVSDNDLLGATFDTMARIVRSFPIAHWWGFDKKISVATDLAGLPFAAFSGWCDDYLGRPYYSTRIWGKLGPFGGISEVDRSYSSQSALTCSPNPFSAHAMIEWTGAQDAKLRVYDATGREIRDLVPSHHCGLRNLTTWDGSDEQGRRVPNGVYFLRTGTLRVPEVATRVVLSR